MSRRHSTHRAVRAHASDVPESVELETRVSRLEILLNDLRDVIDVLSKRTGAVQAQLDHLEARIGRR